MTPNTHRNTAVNFFGDNGVILVLALLLRCQPDREHVARAEGVCEEDKALSRSPGIPSLAYKSILANSNCREV